MTWCYNERHYGKGPMGGIGGTIKNKVFRDVKSGKTQIIDAESFAKYGDNTINGIKSLYLPECDVFEEPDDIEDAPKIAGTLEVHKIVREFNDDNVCKLKFFKLATDEKSFSQQWYRLVIQKYETIPFYLSCMTQITHVRHVENRILQKRTG